MDKVFEALEDFKELKEVLANQKIKYAGIVNFNLDTIEQALLELKAIKEANPSEALFYLIDYIKFDTCYDKDFLIKKVNTIKQALLKAQEQEKVLKIVFEKKVELMALFLSSSVEQYNNQFIRDENKLTQEEFDLLKGYFKWKRK